MDRLAIDIQGIVQGVGFRPFVYGLATRLGLGGFVQNRVGGVWIEVEGDAHQLDQFLDELANRAPPLAHIENLTWQRRVPVGERQFKIHSSAAASPGPVFVSPDVATCADCLAEMLDLSDRRHGYPFLNCTNCGPRLTIVTGVPYDRQRTTMAGFALCPACRAEYEDPTNRRFHAQPTCCPVCGPRLQLLDARGQPVVTPNPLADFAAALHAGRIGALKGLGGYHLACAANSEAAVVELRRRKHREEKPFALMVADETAAACFCHLDPAERELLNSARRPIVLLRQRAATGLPAALAPGNPYLGVMLPYTPLHHLLLRAMAGTPLVMTSGNRSDEPIAYEDADALQRLAGIADLFLIHNRPIHLRCDDSVTRIVAGQELPLRRSRGYAPQPLALPVICPLPILAVGGQLKGTFALGRGKHAFLSHHLGDLDHYDAYRAFVKDIDLYERLFGIEPALLAHDLHPDYASTRYAEARAAVAERPIRLLAVQHHHAHMASCMAENGLTEPALGVSFDGTGYGPDGAIWGGEFLVGGYREYRRAAHLRYVGMPGGDQAIKEPWRMALAFLLDARLDARLLRTRVPAIALRTATALLERGFNAPPTSSAGRLFDAVAVLAGVRERVSYEGQAACELEWLAAEVEENGAYPFDIVSSARDDPAGFPLQVDTRPLFRRVAQDVERGIRGPLIARRFHSTLVEMIVAVCTRLRQATGLEVVVLSGGVFLNALLTREVEERLRRYDFRVYRHRLVPPGDGGLSLGQLAIAAHQVS